MKYYELLNENAVLGKSLTTDKYSILVLSNIIVHQIKEILEYNVRLANINAVVKIGKYDNIVQESQTNDKYNLVIIFWEVSNLIDGFQYKSLLMGEDGINNMISKIKSEIDLVITSFVNKSFIIINKFSSLVFNHSFLDQNNLDKVCIELNNYLEKKKMDLNFKIIDIDKIISKLSIANAIDFRYYYSSKNLYSIEFFYEYVDFIKPIIFSLNGHAKKVLIFDCDNTLWKGILGEDGIDNIKYSSNQSGGVVFEEVQSLAKSLIKKGVILALCSKNNEKDVLDILRTKNDMILKDEDFAIHRINWDDKATNLLSISKELNVGIESIVFIDDSDFEINFAKEKFPEITTCQVPTKIYQYPSQIKKLIAYFYNVTETEEDLKRSNMYRTQSLRVEEKNNYSNLEDYLKSLNIKIIVFENEKDIIPRISQMTQKTNQFNMTTKRYSESEILAFIESDTSFVYAISVSDKYGDNGVTGLSIIIFNNNVAFIDTLLLSCRIIGRKIELVFIDYIVDSIKEMGFTKVRASYRPTLKNSQVSDFYEKLGFNIINKTQDKEYELNINDYKYSDINYIEKINGKKINRNIIYNSPRKT